MFKTFVSSTALKDILVFRNSVYDTSWDSTLNFVVSPTLIKRSLEDAVDHSTHILRSHLTADYHEIIQNVKTTLLHFIRSSTIASISDLIKTIETNVLFKVRFHTM